MRRLALVSVLLAACSGGAGDDETGPPPPCDHVAAPARSMRVFAVGHELTATEAESYDQFAAAFRATVERDVRPHLATDRPNVLVFPEDVALTAAFIGARGAQARAESKVVAAYDRILAAVVDAFAYYRDVAPAAGLGTLILLATTDPTWRAFDQTFSGIARDLGVYVVASLDVGDVAPVEDPALAAQLGDPERPAGPVYGVPDATVYNQAVVYGPTGERLGRARKVYLTDLEHDDLGITGHLPEQVTLDVAGLGRLAAAISRDAWMPDLQERIAAGGADLVLQHEAFSTWTVPADGEPWPADNLKRSGWACVQKHPELRMAAAPMLVGHFFDVTFDGQSFIAVPGTPSQSRAALLAQEPDTGWAAIGPWAADDPGTGTLADRRAALRAIGEDLLPGGANPTGHVEGTVWFDLDVPADDGYPVVADAAPGAEPPVLGSSVPIESTGAGRQRTAAPVVLSDGALVVAWEDTRFCTGQIVVARSDDRGVTFAPAVRVSPWNRPQHAPALVALPDDTLVVAWQEVMGPGRAEIRVATSRDRGVTWTRRVRIDADASVDAWVPALAADAVTGAVHLAFVDSRGDAPNRRIYLARSDDGGAAWSAPVRVDPRERPSSAADHTLSNEWSPRVAARGDHVVVAYTHRERPDPAEQPSDDAFVIESVDGGAGFGPPRRLDAGGFPERLADGLGLAMDATGWRLALSTVRGTAPDADVAIAGPADGLAVVPDVTPGRDQWWPSLAPAGDGSWVIAWQDFRNGGNDIYLARLDAAGTLGPALRVDDAGDSDAQAWRPRIAVGLDGTIYVVWEDSRTGHAELRVVAGVLPAGGG